QDVVYSDAANSPDELVVDWRVFEQHCCCGDVEIDVVSVQPFRGARRANDVPEAEVHASQVRENELRLRRLKGEVEQLLAVARDNVEIIHQYDHPELGGTRYDGQDAGVRGIELLRVRVQLEHLEAESGDAGDFHQRRCAIIGVDRGDRHHLRM